MPLSISTFDNKSVVSSDPGNGFVDDFLREKNIKPHEVQESLLSLPDSIFDALYGGAAYGGKYNEQKHSWEWPEFNSYQDFGHVQHAGDIVQYDSSQYNYCAFDELTHFSSYPYHYMVGSRVRPSS